MKLLRRILTATVLASLCGIAASQNAEPRFDVRVENAPARAFFEGLADGTPKNMLVHPDVTGRVTVHLKQVTLEEALDAMRDLYGYDYRPVARGYMVLPATLQTRIFHLNYLDLQRTGVSKTRVSSGQITQGGNTNYGSTASSSGSGDTTSAGTEVTGTSVLTRNESDFWAAVDTDLKLIVGASADRSVVINRQSGVIVVRAMPPELRDVSDYVARTQSTVTRQVVLEAKIVEVELKSAYQAGINWAAVLTDGNNQFLIGQRSPPGGFDADPLVPRGGNVTVAPGNPLSGFVTDVLGSAITFAADTPDFNAFIELLGAQGRTHVLSSPRVSTLHNQKAIIKAGSDEFFVTGVDSDTTTGTATTTSVKVELTPFFSGVALDVTPQISEDGGVLLHIHPTVSEVTDQNKQVTFAGTTSNLPLALSQIRESDSVVKARNGQLIVIGGLMREMRKRNNYKTPWLGDVPGVGRLFRSERDQMTTVELVILLRPIVAQDADWPKLVKEPMDRVEALRQTGGLDAEKP
jgi:MSHA biogenesis protein MshL